MISNLPTIRNLNKTHRFSPIFTRVNKSTTARTNHGNRSTYDAPHLAVIRSKATHGDSSLLREVYARKKETLREKLIKIEEKKVLLLTVYESRI